MTAVEAPVRPLPEAWELVSDNVPGSESLIRPKEMNPEDASTILTNVFDLKASLLKKPDIIETTEPLLNPLGFTYAEKKTVRTQIGSDAFTIVTCEGAWFEKEGKEDQKREPFSSAYIFIERAVNPGEPPQWTSLQVQEGTFTTVQVKLPEGQKDPTDNTSEAVGAATAFTEEIGSLIEHL